MVLTIERPGRGNQVAFRRPFAESVYLRSSFCIINMKRLLLTTACLLTVFAANCSHIVGAELYYDCSGTNVYHITLKLYRDCFCQQCANYGNPEYVTIFDASGNVFSQVAMPRPDTVDLPPTYTSPCMGTPPSVCITEADYTGDVVLPPAVGGYTIVYQRCCRNNGVVNLSAGQGATYTAMVPGSALASCNNSARFNHLPPIFICQNAPLTIDYSAHDPDGDSLVYSLCDPYDGANGNCPDPSPNGGLGGGCPTAPNAPPYTAAIYNAPYTASNFTNNPANINDITIDPRTGLLTGVPNTAGLFDITVCVNEYRNGVLINILRRDFQFTVTPCNFPIAAVPDVAITGGIGVYTVACKSLTVNFTNTSFNPTTNPLTYHWDFGVTGSTSDTSNVSAPTFTYPDTGTYLAHLIVSTIGQGGQLCSDTTSAFVYVYPTFNTAFTTANVCADSVARFTDQTISTSGLTNIWNWNFGDGTSSTLKNPTHTYTPGTYTVTLINQNILGCKDTAVHSITVYPVPVAAFSDTFFCFSTPTVFSDSSTGSISTYNWNFGNGASSVSTQINPSYTYTAPGNYTATLLVTSPDGCMSTATSNIVIHPLPVIATSGDVSICPFTSTQLTASGGASYVWTPASYLSDSSLSNPVATPPPPNSITYTVHVTSAFGCTGQSALTVSFFAIPHANAGIDTSVCLNPSTFRDSVQLNPSGGVTYQWSPAAGLSNPNIANPLAKPTVTTTYDVTATDINGCTASDSVTVYVLDPTLNLILQNSMTICQYDTAFPTIVNQGASAYGWAPNLFISNPGSYHAGFYPPVTTTYVLTVSNYCYLKSDSILITVNPVPLLGLPPVDSICIGTPYQFNAQNAVSYVWNPQPSLSSTSIANPIATPTISTKYIVTGTSANGCVNKDSTLLLVYEPSTISTYPQDTPFICQGSSAPLRAFGAYTYVWSPAATLSSANVANPFATPLDTTQYNVVATNVHGCKSYDSLVINVEMPVVAVAPTPFVACEGIPVQLHASGGPFFSWSPSAGLNDTVTNDPFALPDSTTLYTVKVFNDCFSSNAVVEVDIHPLPVVDAGPDTTIWRDTYATLHGTANVTTYFWDPSTWLENASLLNTTASPPQTTRYYLFGIDQYGCKNKDSVLITVIPHTELLVPTGFSPNGDGVNDEFRIVRSLNIEKLFEFSVFDRWGEKVFSTTNIDQGWDGTHEGQPSPLGVYVWIIVAQTKDGQEISKKGNVTLLR